jgi:hypothetical protein
MHQSIIDAVNEKLTSIKEAASQSYINVEYDKGVQLYGKALELAKQIDDQKQIVFYKFWKGECLKQDNKYKQALAEFIECLTFTSENIDKADIFNARTGIIAIGLSIPTSLKAIKKALEQTEQFINSAGSDSFWRAKTLKLISDLQAAQGNVKDAFLTMQEAWALWKNRYPCYIESGYHDNLIDLAIQLEEYDFVIQQFAKWEEISTEHIVSKKKGILNRRFHFARSTRSKESALAFARELAALDSDEPHYLAVAHLFNGNLNLAKEIIIRYVKKNRKQESLYTHQYCFKLLGDYHYSLARNILNLPAIDLDFSSEYEFSIPGSTQFAFREDRLRKELQSCLWNYKRYFNIAAKIDERLECYTNTKEAKIRIDRLKYLYFIIFGEIIEIDLSFNPVFAEKESSKDVMTIFDEEDALLTEIKQIVEITQEITSDERAHKLQLLETFIKQTTTSFHSAEELFKFLGGEKLYGEFIRNPSIFDDFERTNLNHAIWNYVEFWNNPQPLIVLDVSEIGLPESIELRFDILQLLRLIAYSIGTNGHRKKNTVLEKLPQLSTSQVERIFRLYLSEHIETFKLAQTDELILDQYRMQKREWEKVLEEKLKI